MKINVQAAEYAHPIVRKELCKIIDGKARLISDLFCDGLGGTIKACPENAMEIEEREAEEYDESKVMVNSS